MKNAYHIGKKLKKKKRKKKSEQSKDIRKYARYDPLMAAVKNQAINPSEI